MEKYLLATVLVTILGTAAVAAQTENTNPGYSDTAVFAPEKSPLAVQPQKDNPKAVKNKTAPKQEQVKTSQPDDNSGKAFGKAVKKPIVK